MRAVPAVLAVVLTLGMGASAQQPPAPQTAPVKSAAPPPAITAPQKDDVSTPGVPQTAAQQAAQQGTTPTPAQTGNPANTAIPGASAQTPANTIQSNVRLVVLDMVVLDAKGNAIRDLRRDEFHVTESDEVQAVRSFDAPGKYTPDPQLTIESTADLDRLAPRAPVNIVLLDEFNTLFEDMAFARYSLKKWLEKQPDKLETPTMLVAVNLQEFKVLRDYTQNKTELINALDHHFSAYPWQARGLSWANERYATAFLTLRRVAEAVNGHPGHINMIWIGRGFPTISRSHISIDDESRINSQVQLTVNELRDSRVTLYTIDPAGVMIDPGKYGMDAQLFSPFGGNPDFEALARATGGRTLHGRNDVDVEIGSSVREGSSFYTLTYRPTDTSRDFNKFHRIKVTVDRPGLTVVTRQGYFLDRRPPHLAQDGSASKRLLQELAGAGNSNMAYDAVVFTARSDAANPGTYLIHVDSRSLVWTYATDTEPRRCKVLVTATTFDKKGKLLKADGHSLTASAPASVPPTGRIERAMDFPYKLAPDSKAVRVRFVVRVDANGRMGTADLPLDRPGAIAESRPASPADNPANATPAPKPPQ